jgi:allantoinase
MKRSRYATPEPPAVLSPARSRIGDSRIAGKARIGAPRYWPCLLTWTGGEATAADLGLLQAAAHRWHAGSTVVAVDRATQIVLLAGEPTQRITRGHLREGIAQILRVVHERRPGIEVQAKFGERIRSSESLPLVTERLRRSVGLDLGLHREVAVSARSGSLSRFLDGIDAGHGLAFVQEQLAVLVEHDRAHRTDLLGVVELALDHPKHNTAAEAAYMHRNTFRRQLAKALSLLQVCLDDPEQRLALHLALKMRSDAGCGCVERAEFAHATERVTPSLAGPGLRQERPAPRSMTNKVRLMRSVEVSERRIPFELSSERRSLPPLDGRRLIVHLVVNVEGWAFHRPIPHRAVQPAHGGEYAPDVPNCGWIEYGLRCGLPRIIELLRKVRVPASVSFDAEVIDTHPMAAEVVRQTGWEFVGHGVSQRSLLLEADEAAAIDECLTKIESFTGTRPRGWLGPGGQETFETPDLLRAAGIEYVLDWAVDDLPVWLETQAGRLIALPYTVELNDSVLYAVDRQPSNALEQRVRDTVHTFEAELNVSPRTLTLALTPHLIGVPHRIGYLGKALAHLTARDDVTFVTGSRMADWFKAAEAT